MIREHWFDRLNKLLTQDAPRRGVVGTLTALALGHGLIADNAAGKNKSKGRKNGDKGGKNGKNHGKGNNKKKQNGNNNRKGNSGSGNGGSGNGSGSGNGLPPQCGEDACGAHLPEDQWIACVEKCGRCRVEEQFCVIVGDAEHPDTHATCCFEHQRCCQDSRRCCDKTDVCCGGDNPSACCPQGRTCCASASAGCCLSDETCCPGLGCRNLSVDETSCGECGKPCASGETCRNGRCECPVELTRCGDRCVDIERDPEHCGGCFAYNPNNLPCCQGRPCIYINGECCNDGCHPEGWVCS
jgi:hypothetical protein